MKFLIKFRISPEGQKQKLNQNFHKIQFIAGTKGLMSQGVARVSHGITVCDFDKKAISSTIFMEKNYLTSGIYAKYLHKQLLGFRIFIISLFL